MYQRKGGEAYPSATTILSVIGKPFLIHWAAKQERLMIYKAVIGLEEKRHPETDTGEFLKVLEKAVGKEKAHKKLLDKAGEIGTAIHALIEWDIGRRLGLTEPRPTKGEEAEHAFQAWLAWTSTLEVFNPVLLESKLYSPKDKLGGRIDWTAEIDDGGGLAYYIGDNKSGKAIYPEYILQLAMYRQMLRSLGQRVPEKGIIVRVPKVVTDPDAEIRVFSTAELDEAEHVAECVKRLYWFLRSMEEQPEKPEIVEV